jgi:hypothetical protein
MAEQMLNLNYIISDTRSSSFTVLQKEILDYDAVEVKLTVNADFHAIDGLEFRWRFMDPSAVKYSRVSRIIMSILHAYIIAIYISFISFDTFSMTELLCIGIGVAGITASNPMTMFLPSIWQARYLDHALIASYVALLRFFVLLQFEVIRGKRSSAPWFLIVIASGFFGTHAMVDAAANFDRAQAASSLEMEFEAALPSEMLGAEFDMLHFAVTGAWMVLAIVQSWQFAPKRLFVFVLAALGDMAATAFAQIYCVMSERFSFTIVPEMVHIATHLTTGAFLVWFMHPEGGDIPYEALGTKRSTGNELVMEEMTTRDRPDEGFRVS